jgi:hypothetical protein
VMYWTNDKVNIAIESAFNTLIESAQKQGLSVVRPMGLMELGSQDLTSNFQNACTNILNSLNMEPV